MRVTLMMCLFAISIAACGGGNSSSGKTSPPAHPESKLQDEYQVMLSLFKEYVIANAFVSVSLQDDGVQPDGEELAELREDERKLQTVLIMCYEFAYHVNNFSRKDHRTSADTAADAINSIRESQPRFPERSIPRDEYAAFSKARNDYLDQMSVFFRALSDYLDATK